jgi:hypothetical protein
MKKEEMKQNISNYLVYRAINLETNETYVGTTTHSLESRIKDHLQKANNGSGHTFQQAIGTYGPEAFVWEEIDTANSINELAEKEKDYIFKYNSKDEGYNSDSGGGFKKSVYQYDLDGNLVAEYDSLQSAASAVNANKKSISNACLGNNRSCKDYYWSYQMHLNYIVQDNRKKEVLQFSLSGEFIAKYNSVAEASEKSGLSKTCIARVCRGERKISGGFIWSYAQ